MPRTMKVIWLFAILCPISACSSLSVVYGPGGAELPPDLNWTEIVEPGESIRVTLADGQAVAGTAARVAPDTLAIMTKTKEINSAEAASEYEPDSFYDATITEIVAIPADEDLYAIELPRFSIVKTVVLVVCIAAPIATTDLDR